MPHRSVQTKQQEVSSTQKHCHGKTQCHRLRGQLSPVLDPVLDAVLWPWRTSLGKEVCDETNQKYIEQPKHFLLNIDQNLMERPGRVCDRISFSWAGRMGICWQLAIGSRSEYRTNSKCLNQTIISDMVCVGWICLGCQLFFQLPISWVSDQYNTIAGGHQRVQMLSGKASYTKSTPSLLAHSLRGEKCVVWDRLLVPRSCTWMSWTIVQRPKILTLFRGRPCVHRSASKRLRLQSTLQTQRRTLITCQLNCLAHSMNEWGMAQALNGKGRMGLLHWKMMCTTGNRWVHALFCLNAINPGLPYQPVVTPISFVARNFAEYKTRQLGRISYEICHR